MAKKRHKDDRWDGSERRAPASVLIVNDEADACELLVRFLRHAGFNTSGAHSDVEAMSVIHTALPRCVVLDMTTGGVGSSLKILDQIRTSHDRRINSARVVLCASSPKNRSFSFQSGADAFIVRPFHLQDLIDHVADVISRPQEERANHRRDELVRHGDA
jgi:DNA-binding response OmpR family regulator